MTTLYHYSCDDTDFKSGACPHERLQDNRLELTKGYVNILFATIILLIKLSLLSLMSRHFFSRHEHNI